MKGQKLFYGTKQMGNLAVLGPQAAALGLLSPALDLAAQYLPTQRLRGGARFLADKAQARQEKISTWFKLNLGWIILVLSTLTVIFVALFFLRFLGELYGFLWGHTTGEPWTYIMRRNGWLLIVPSFCVFGIYVFSAQATSDDIQGLPDDLKPRLRAKVIIRLLGLLLVAFGIGFLYGHVFWGEKTRTLVGR